MDFRASAEFWFGLDLVARFSSVTDGRLLRERRHFRAVARGLFLGLPEINRDHRERRDGATHPPLCDDVAR
jgi:hypothetical protein